MPTGTVKWFNNAKGFGFILPEDGGEDLFAHFSAIEMAGYKTLKAGQTVEFGVIQGEKGLHATGIRVTDSETSSNTQESSQKNNSYSEEVESESSFEHA